MPKLSSIIRTLRDTHGGLSTPDFGERVGISGQFVSLIELGNRGISDKTAQRIADAFGRTPEDKRALLHELRRAMVEYQQPGILRDGADDATRAPGERPRPAFVARVRQDLARRALTELEITEGLGISAASWAAFLRGDAMLERHLIAPLASWCGAPEAEYYLLAGFLPPELTVPDALSGPVAGLLSRFLKLDTDAARAALQAITSATCAQTLSGKPLTLVRAEATERAALQQLADQRATSPEFRRLTDLLLRCTAGEKEWAAVANALELMLGRFLEP